jgi:propionyl-CoA carboxylase alpha chain
MYYDPMICKLCTHAEDREGAIDLMKTALDHYVIEGLRHNIPLLYDICTNSTFRSGELSTDFLKNEYPDGFKTSLPPGATEKLAAAAMLVYDMKRNQKTSFGEGQGLLPGFKLPPAFEASVRIKGIDISAEHMVNVVSEADGLSVSVDGDSFVDVATNYFTEPIISATVDSETVNVQVLKETPLGYQLYFSGALFNVEVLNAAQAAAMVHMPVIPELDLSKVVVAPISGTIKSIAVAVGDKVAPGQEICVLEAMKMHNVIRANGAGVVKAINFQEADVTTADDVIVELET